MALARARVFIELLLIDALEANLEKPTTLKLPAYKLRERSREQRLASFNGWNGNSDNRSRNSRAD
jgi:hypothetical protein